MNFTKKILLAIFLGACTLVFSQNYQPVLTGAPFLRISPDAKAGGLGDQGVATTPDVFSQYWNASKYIFSKNTSGVGFSYTPWMGKLTNDVFLLYGSYYSFLGEEERSTISASLYYFNMGSIELNTLPVGGGDPQFQGTAKPNEFSLDVAYGLKLSDTYSMAVTGRYIRSDLSGGFNSDNTLKAANSFAIDVSGYFMSNKGRSFGDYEGQAKVGWAIQNLGPKLDYTGDSNSRSYLPTLFRLGGGYDLFVDDYNRVGLSLEMSKLLVPGPDASGTIPNVGVIEGIGKSFSNKKSIMLSVAGEYEYDNAFAVRAGYFNESPEQGARQYATVGVGFKYQSFGLDLSYLINTSKVNSALDNTLRFGLTWNIGSESSNADY